jgi:hypothetical protein
VIDLFCPSPWFAEVSQGAPALASAAFVQLIPRRETALLRNAIYD